MLTPDLLKALLEANGPSGHEGPVAAVWREAAAAFAEVSSDTVGNSYARVGPGNGAPTLALIGHIDEIGVAITHIEDSGVLSFATIGGIAPEVQIGQRVTIAGKAGAVPGLIARKRVTPEERRKGSVDQAELHIDIGAADRDDAATMVAVGDAGVWEGAPVELPNGRLISKALDNRLGAYIALETARRVAEVGDSAFDVVAVAAVGEEVGYFGSRPAAFGLDPQAAVAIDVTHATDVPGGNPRLSGKVDLGGGATVMRGPMVNTHLYELLVAAAEADSVPYAVEIETRATMTDADAFHVARAGIPTGLVSIPLRYMHSPTELVSLNDVESAIQLLTAFARSLPADQSFLR